MDMKELLEMLFPTPVFVETVVEIPTKAWGRDSICKVTYSTLRRAEDVNLPAIPEDVQITSEEAEAILLRYKLFKEDIYNMIKY